MKKQIQFSYEATYSLSHEPTFAEEEIWLLLHGYGQLAEFFIRKFQSFDSASRLFIAPEATNYNYLEGFRGRVGANWMTKHEREIAIANNHRYLDQLLSDLLAGYQIKPRINVLGFSQGAATATRWVSNWDGQVQRLILWAGGFAEDLEMETTIDKFSGTRLMMVLGDRDQLIQPESIEKQDELIRNLGIPVQKLFFEGGHELDEVLLGKIILDND